MLSSARTPAKRTAINPGTKAFIERRTTRRIHTVCRFARVTSRSGQGLWRVCNISDYGMMFRTLCPVKPGERLAIALSEGIGVDAVVIWSEPGCCGVHFDAPVDSAALLGALARDRRSPRYRPLRVAVDAAALVYDETGVHPVRLRNLSRCGVGLRHAKRIRRGSTVKLVFGNGVERRGVVRWANDEQAGLLLLEPLAPHELACAGRS